MDLTPTIAAKSDQLNAEDLLAGPVTVTIVEVTNGPAEQPVNIITEEFGPKRPYKPNKTMRRLMVTCWGKDTSPYSGRMLTLYRDPHVKWAGEEVGGIRIAAMSHLGEARTVTLMVSRGHREPITVQPLETPNVEQPKDTSGRDWLTELTQTEGDPDLIFALGKAAKEAHAAKQVMQIITTAYQDAKKPAVEQAELDQEAGQ